jgi:hypothetical protein
LVNKHFGEEEGAPAAPKKAAKKAAKRKLHPKVAARSKAKKAEKTEKGKRGRKKAAKAVSVEESTAAVAAPKKAQAPKASKRAALETDSRVGQAIEDTRNAVRAYADAVDVLKRCQEGQSVNDGLSKAAAGVTQLIEAMDRSIVQPLTGFPSPAEQRGAELFRKAAPSAVTPDNGGRVHPVVPPVVPPVASTLPVIPPTFP